MNDIIGFGIRSRGEFDGVLEFFQEKYSKSVEKL